MENYFYSTLNGNTVEAVRRNAAFFMSPPDSRIPAIMDSYRDQPITGVNYFNLKLANDLSGKGHTEYVRMSEALASNRDWLSTLPRKSRPRGTLYREEGATSNAGYSFVMPTAELNQNIYRDNRVAAPMQHYVPFQSSNATMANFNDFVHEQFANAVNASLTGCPFRNNIRPQEADQFRAQLVSEISRNPAFMAMAANRARDEALNYHCLPYDRNKFIERARDEASPEFMRLNSAINHHVHDMYHNRRMSFNPEFNELARPLIVKVGDLYLRDPHHRRAVDHEIADFVKTMIRQEKPAKVLADTFAGTFIEKAIKLANVGKKIFAGVMIVGAVCGIVDPSTVAPLLLMQRDTVKQVMGFCKNVAHKLGGGDITPSRLDDVVKVAGNVMTAQEMKGNNALKACRDRDDPRAFYACLNQTIRDHPQTLDQAIAQLNHSRQHDRTQSMPRGQAMHR
jgi:hypothetical protein